MYSKHFPKHNQSCLFSDVDNIVTLRLYRLITLAPSLYFHFFLFVFKLFSLIVSGSLLFFFPFQKKICYVKADNRLRIFIDKERSQGKIRLRISCILSNIFVPKAVSETKFYYYGLSVALWVLISCTASATVIAFISRP